MVLLVFLELMDQLPPALQGTDSNTGINFASDTVNINTGGQTRVEVLLFWKRGYQYHYAQSHKLHVSMELQQYNYFCCIS